MVSRDTLKEIVAKGLTTENATENPPSITRSTTERLLPGTAGLATKTEKYYRLIIHDETIRKIQAAEHKRLRQPVMKRHHYILLTSGYSIRR